MVEQDVPLWLKCEGGDVRCRCFVSVPRFKRMERFALYWLGLEGGLLKKWVVEIGLFGEVMVVVLLVAAAAIASVQGELHQAAWELRSTVAP